MAVAHIAFNSGTPHGQLLHSALQRLEGGYQDLVELRDTLSMMIDGDGSNAAHFAYMQGMLGLPDNATAKAAYDELNSVLGKLGTDGQVTFVNAALHQVFNKFRQ